jgi:hypothetical protein
VFLVKSERPSRFSGLPHARGGVFSTYVINKYDFICDNCGKPWSEEIREEK